MAYTIEEMICEIEEDENSIPELYKIIDLCETKISNIKDSEIRRFMEHA